MVDTIEKRNPWWSILVKETKCEDIFTPEDFTEEQLMMRDSERVCRQRVVTKDRFEKRIMLTRKNPCEKAGELGL
jgi:hypothetical protein